MFKEFFTAEIAGMSDGLKSGGGGGKERVVIWRYNLPPLVEIGLTDLQKICLHASGIPG